MRLILRLCLAVLRAGLIACSVTLTGWFIVAPPNGAELRALSREGQDPADLRRAVVQRRLARAALAVAPDLTVDLITRQGQGSVSREQVAASLQAIAQGRSDVPDEAPVAAVRVIGGAKFERPAPDE